MNIIKQFESNEFAIKKSAGNINSFWLWGLGDDGILYGKGLFAGNYLMGEWSPYYLMGEWAPYEVLSFGIPLSEMKKIVKEFGHLLVWL